MISKIIGTKSLLIPIFIAIHTFVCQEHLLAQKSSSFKFSDFYWREKVYDTFIGPGPNYFGLHRNNVFIDEKGYLHLSIRKRFRKWSCAEIGTDSIVSEGKYEVHISSDNKNIPVNVVIGLFIYDESHPPLFNEIDVEIAKWNDPTLKNAQHVVYSDTGMMMNRFDIPNDLSETIHAIEVRKDSVFVKTTEAISGHQLYYSAFARPPEMVFKQAKFRINLWLSQPPTDTNKIPEVVIKAFNYTAISN